MKIKKLSAIIMFSFASLTSFNLLATELVSKVDLKKVTLFLNGAELQGTSSISVPKGESEIILTNLANHVNANSINVGVGRQAMILSTTLADNYLIKRSESDKLKLLQTTLKQFQNEQNILNIKLIAVNAEIALLSDNRIDTITSSKSSLTEARQAINFIKDNLVHALTEQMSLRNELDAVANQIKNYQAQIDTEEGNNNSAQKAIKIKIYADDAITLPITLSYTTHDAGWQPIYDVRVNDIDSPLVLTYKAKIYQQSGLNWNNIDFTLSTANPSQGITPDILTPWHIYLDNNKSSYPLMAASEVLLEPALNNSNPFYTKDASLKQSSPMTNYVIADNNGLNLQYHINLPYTIMGHSNDNIITLKNQQVATQYRYTATPKLDDNVFLQAEISDWDKLSLLPGKSTVFFKGNYIGEGFITTKGIKDKLSISLGRDNAIIIARHQNLNETSTPSFFGNNISQKFAYTIDIKNTKTLPIDITIYDQLPVITNQTISLEDAKYQGADYNKETGLLTWQLNLPANAVRQLPFSFKVSYPMNKANSIIGL